MKIKKFDEIEAQPYPSDKAKNASGRVAIGKADGAENYCMRIMEVHKDGNTAFHSHDCGTGVPDAYHNGQWQDFKAGDVMYIPPNEEHQFKNTGEEPVLFVCVIPSGPPEL